MKLVPDLFFFFKKKKKALSEIKVSSLQLSYNYILIVLNLAYNKNKLYKTLDYRPRDTLNFDILEKDLEIVSPPHFV